MTQENKKFITKKEKATDKQSVGFSSDIVTVINGSSALGIKAFTAMNVHSGKKSEK